MKTTMQGEHLLTDKREKENYIRCNQLIELFEELNIGAFIVDFNRQVQAMNYSAQALMGLRESDVVGRDCRDVFWGVPCLVQCLIRGDTDGEGVLPDVAPWEEPDTEYLVTRIAAPIFDPDNTMVGCLTILQDHSPIADLINRVQYDERNMKIVLDSLDVGIFTVNRGGRITFFNQAAENISGYKRDRLLGQKCSELFEGEDAPDVKLLRESINTGETLQTHHGRIAARDGVLIPIRANYMALKNEKGGIVGGLATFHDLTLVKRLDRAISGRYTFHDMIGKSPVMQKIFNMASVVAKSDATILIEGATGTGKDLLANIIHTIGSRMNKPMVKINCAAIPENLLESELFGYVKGAFTGAEQDKPGRFELADGGTIFLDEIGDLPVSLQAKLLRVLEDKEFYPLGSRETCHVDVRIISATNRDLEQLVKKGQFREDLYYRINVMQFKLPSLADRREDLPLLIAHLLRKLNAGKSKAIPTPSKEVMEHLLNYTYPGNVRELENILEHTLIICKEDIIRIGDLPVYLQEMDELGKEEGLSPPSGRGNISKITREKIAQTLNQFGGHRAKSATALGIDRTTLWRKMKKYGILT